MNFFRRHLRRVASFMTCGSLVFVFSTALMYGLVSLAGMHSTPAYILQSLVCIALNFELNRRWTWGDCRYEYWKAARDFFIQRIGITAMKAVSLTILVSLSVHYMVAYVGLVVVFGVVNYIMCHTCVFVSKKRKDEETPRREESSSAYKSAAPRVICEDQVLVSSYASRVA